MKTNNHLGCDFDSLPVDIIDNKAQYLLNVIGEAGVLKRRDSIVAISNIKLLQGEEIIAVDSLVTRNGNSVVTYLIKNAQNSLKVIVYDSDLSNIEIQIDEKAPLVIQKYQPRVILVEAKSTALFMINIEGVAAINTYQFAVDASGAVSKLSQYEKIAYSLKSISPFIRDMEMSVDQSSLFVGGTDVLAMMSPVYVVNSNYISSIPSNRLFQINGSFGELTSLTLLQDILLVGTKKNLAKLIQSKTSSGSVVYSLVSAAYGIGIGNNKAIYILQNMIFCASSLGFFKFNTSLVDNSSATYIKNINTIEDYRVNGLYSLSEIISEKTIRIFPHGRKPELAEVFFASGKKSSLVYLPHILSLKEDMVDYFQYIVSGETSAFRFAFNMYTDSSFPIYRSTEIMEFAETAKISSLPKFLDNWVKTAATPDAIYSDSRLNIDYFNKISKPLNQDKINGRIPLFFDDIGVIYTLLKEGKRDIVGVKDSATGTITTKEQTYPIVFISKGISDDQSKSIRVLFSIGYQNSDGSTYNIDNPIDEYSMYIGTVNNRSPLSFAYDENIDMSVDRIRSMHKSNILQTNSSKMGISCSAIFITTSLVIDILFGLSASDVKASYRHSNSASSPY